MNEDKYGIILPHEHLHCGGILRQVRTKGNFIIVYYCDKCKREVNTVVGKSGNDLKEEREKRGKYRQKILDEKEKRAYEIFERLLVLIYDIKGQSQG